MRFSLARAMPSSGSIPASLVVPERRTPLKVDMKIQGLRCTLRKPNTAADTNSASQAESSKVSTGSWMRVPVEC